jgi:hypothetical protein
MCLAVAAAAQPVIRSVTPEVLFVEVAASASFLVEISESAPPGGVTVLVLNPSSIVSTPSSLTIPEGETQAQVPVLGLSEGDGEVSFQLGESVFVCTVSVRTTITDVSEYTAPICALHQNAPNPFNPLTTIRFDLPETGRVRLSILDVAGRLVCVLIDESLPPGSHETVWDGRDSSGRGVSSGAYLARLVFAGKVETMRIGLLR